MIKIYNTEEKSKCRQCGDKDETGRSYFHMTDNVNSILDLARCVLT